MKTTDLTTNGVQSDTRVEVTSAGATNGNPALNASSQDNGKVMMNKPEMDTRGSRADALIGIMNMDTERLGQEAPRMTKIKG